MKELKSIVFIRHKILKCHEKCGILLLKSHSEDVFHTFQKKRRSLSSDVQKARDKNRFFNRNRRGQPRRLSISAFLLSPFLFFS